MTVLQAAAGLDGVRARADAELSTWQVPGLELAVLRDGEPAYCGGLGARDAATPGDVDGATLFHHGSCGKAYTATLAALLAADGLLDLDAPIRDLIPELRLADPVTADRVTTRDVLAHRSGLGRHDLAWILQPFADEAALLRRLPGLPMAGDLRAQWAYSNFGYALAGLACARAAGTPWETLIRERLLEPLGMSRTAVSLDGIRHDANAARPHLRRDGTVQATPLRELGVIAPAGQLVSCAEDSLAWLAAHLGGGALPEAALAETHRPHTLLPAADPPFAELELPAYGLGWIPGRYRGQRIVWHNGGIDGYSTQTLLLPDHRSGIVASANLHSTDYPFAVMMSLADALLGVTDPPDWYERLRPSPAGQDADEPRTELPAAAVHPLEHYAGHYEDRGYGTLTVTTPAAALHVRIGSEQLDARHRHFDTWDIAYPPLDATATVTFHTDATGQVAEAHVQFDPHDAPVRFRRVQPA